MSVVLEWSCTDGNSTYLAATVGTCNLIPIVTTESTAYANEFNRANGKVMGLEGRGFLPCHVNGLGIGIPTVANCLRSSTAIASITTPSISFLFRYSIQITGAFLRFESGSYFRTQANNIQFYTSNCILDGEFKEGEWNHAVFVSTTDTPSQTKIYLNSTYMRQSTQTLTLSGNVRMLSYSNTQFPGGAEICDIKCYNNQLSSADILTLYQSYGARPIYYSIENSGTDYGAVPAYYEYSTVSYLTFPASYTQVMFSGTVCIGGRAAIVPSSIRNLWGYWEMKIPTEFTANTSFAHTVQLFAVAKTTAEKAVTNEILISELWYSSETEVISSYRTRVFTSTGQDVYNHSTFTLVRDTWIPLEFHINYDQGLFDVWYNSNNITHVTGSTTPFNITTVFLGMYQGVHPESSGNYYYGKNYYIGEIQYPRKSHHTIEGNNNLFDATFGRVMI